MVTPSCLFYECDIFKIGSTAPSEWGKKALRRTKEKNANGQMKHCDDLIEASQCFFRLC